MAELCTLISLTEAWSQITHMSSLSILGLFTELLFGMFQQRNVKALLTMSEK